MGEHHNIVVERTNTNGDNDRNKTASSGNPGTCKTEKGTGTGTSVGNTEKVNMGENLGIKPHDVDIPSPPEPKQTKKERKSGSSKKDATIPVAQVSAIITTGFAILATRAGAEWNITEDEAKSIAEPATRILDKLDIIQKLGPYADAIALITAVGMVVVPRVMVTIQKSKRKVKQVAESEKGQNEKSDGSIPIRNASPDATNFAELLPGLA